MNKENLYKLQKLSKGFSVLYIESSEVLQKQISGFLGKLFDNFYQALDTQTGYTKFKTHRPDLLLMDLTNEKKSSIELIVDIKELNPDIKIIIISKHNDDIELLKSIDMGISEILLKPIDMDKLISAAIKAIGSSVKSNLNKKSHNKIEIKKIKKIKIDKTFQVGLYYKSTKVEVQMLKATFESIYLYIKQKDLKYKVGDNIDLTLGFEVKNTSSFTDSTRFTKAFAKANILQIEPYKNGFKIVATLSVQKAGQRDFQKYLQQQK